MKPNDNESWDKIYQFTWNQVIKARSYIERIGLTKVRPDSDSEEIIVTKSENQNTEGNTGILLSEIQVKL